MHQEQGQVSSVPYLVQLAEQLTPGFAQLPMETRTRHTAYLRAAQNPDGGFSGRQGGSDLYYTGFALRSLAMLDVPSGEPDSAD
jgi:geranylgeranyl transferase type-2 subunit beta